MRLRLFAGYLKGSLILFRRVSESSMSSRVDAFDGRYVFYGSCIRDP